MKSDRRIDAAAAAVFRLVPQDARAGFARAERLWLAYRRASCEAESSRFEGGSARPLVVLRCELSRNATHLGELRVTESLFRNR